ncbi:uncharacterized protein [Euphorbia lathyris]|uniref:uncharacterized protein n=1 Tax=Euphorbia lathyris TaxID=212925 RepID=UPI0033131A6A
MDPKGTIIFTTVGRTNYGFDVFSVNLPSDLNHSKLSDSSETRLTDGVSINYNAQFINHHDQSIVYVSERSGCPRIYSSSIGVPKTQQLPTAAESLFHDRPVIKNNRLYFISAHEQPQQPFKSWSALYSSDLDNQNGDVITRLTPYGVVDFSPAISRSGDFIAVASYGSRPWEGDFHELHTDIVVFKESNPEKRVIVCEKGGWPTWSGDETIYFHRQADDGWWSIFQASFPGDLEFSEFPLTPIRVTPPGVHCFTPAAMHDGSRIALATRRGNQTYRHIEIFEPATKTFYPVTETTNPKFHHYNPFVSPNSEFLGYHRFRGESSPGESMIPNIEPVVSPIKGLRMLRISGSFPSFSPAGDLIAINPDFVDADGGLKVVKSDGTKRWSLLKNRVAFCNCWSPTEKHVIYTSIGPIFEAVRTPVQVARITFHPSDLNNGDRDEIASEIKILTREDTGNNAFPSCSPDGKSLVFRSGRSGHKNLYIMDAVDGEWEGNLRQLTNGPWIDTMPSWSPKGDLIAFSSNRHNPENPAIFSIYVIKTDGSDLKRIHVAGVEGSSEVDKERINHVCWSKDGEWMLFTSNMGSVTAEPVSMPNQFQPYGELYVAKSDGSGLRRLTWNGYEDGTPAWFHGDDKDLDFGKLHLDVQDGDRLNGQFDEPLWIKCDI